jgi:hypothetical protein
MATSYKSTKKSAGKRGASKKSTKSASAARAASGGGPLPPYGVAIREASARGDVAEMRRVAASARKWIKDAQGALEKLEARIEKVGRK